jgi:predicted short-subunit dehydrogenase-like oxidoreductase (DUF2520 family)
MSRKSIGIIGAGAVGTALAGLFLDAGHDICGIATRTPSSLEKHLSLLDLPSEHGFSGPGSWCSAADLLFITVPDDQISGVADHIAGKELLSDDTLSVHCSGAHTAEQLLAPLEDPSRDLSIGSFHPLQTIPDPESGMQSIPGARVAVEGAPEVCSELASLAEQIGTRPFVIPPDRKDLYHAAAVFASNHLISVLSVAAELMREATDDEVDPLEALKPLIDASVSNAVNNSPESALTGPAARGDEDTIDVHRSSIEEVDGDYVELYVELTNHCLEIARRRGDLSKELVDRLRSRFN